MLRYLVSLILFLSALVFANPTYAWEHYFDNPEFYNVKISPDGKLLGIVKNDRGKRILLFFDLASNKQVGGLNLAGRNEVGPFYWVSNERVVIKLLQRTPSEVTPQYFGELYAVNSDGKRGELIYGYRAGERQVGSRLKKKEATFGWAEIIDILPNDPKNILISSEKMDEDRGQPRRVYELNVYTGKTSSKQKTAPVPGTTYITDANGKIVVATGLTKDLNNEVYLMGDNDWEKVPGNQFGNDFHPLTLDETGTHLYVLDDYQQDKNGIFKLNLKNGSYKKVYSNDQTDITGVEYTSNNNNIYAVRIDKERLSYVLLNKSHSEAVIFRSLLEIFPGQHVTITSKTADGSKFIVYAGSDINPGQYFLYDKQKNSIAQLFKRRPNIDQETQAEMQPYSFTSSDGLTISGYFTPSINGNSNGIAPLVVLPHGGPHSRDYWDFNPTVQALASNGYSVLQVNFRGSTGYGNQFLRAGFETWGVDIQRDIFEAYQWAIKNGKAEENRACIMGASFGAYSAMQSAVNYPTTYRCAIGNAGVYDLPYLLNAGDISKFYYGEAFLKQTLGSDSEKLKQMSPMYRYDQIQVPVFLAHGKKDERAPYKNAQNFKKVLSKAKVDVEWYIVSGEGHGFYDPDNQKKYMRKVFAFLGKHLK